MNRTVARLEAVKGSWRVIELIKEEDILLNDGYKYALVSDVAARLMEQSLSEGQDVFALIKAEDDELNLGDIRVETPEVTELELAKAQARQEARKIFSVNSPALNMFDMFEFFVTTVDLKEKGYDVNGTDKCTDAVSILQGTDAAAKQLLVNNIESKDALEPCRSIYQLTKDRIKFVEKCDTIEEINDYIDTWYL